MTKLKYNGGLHEGSKDLIILGSGGLAQEYAWLVEEINDHQKTFNLLGYLEDNPDKIGKQYIDYPVLGQVSDAQKYFNAYFITGVGDPRVRKLLVDKVKQYDLKWANLVSPTVRLHDSHKIGHGVMIGRYTDLTVGCEIGNHVMINIHVVLGHAVKVGDFSVISPNVTINGEGTLGNMVYIGANAFVRNLNIGDGSTVGAGSVVVKDVPENCVVAGVPAKIIHSGAPSHKLTRIPKKDESVIKSRHRIYLSPPHMSEEGYELEFIKDAFESNWIAPVGPHVDTLEKEMSKYCGSSYAVALSSGTAALHLALILLGVNRDDLVFCSSFTFSASANSIVYQNATPVFVDSDNHSWNMDPELLDEELLRCSEQDKLPKAVIVVDLYGQSADYEAILKSCRKYDVPVIEDAAEALGATYRGKKCGSFGIAGVLSFNGNKIITTSGGGMLISDNRDLIEKARFLATQARDPAPHYQHSEIGYNYRMSNVLAAIGRGQLKVLDKRVEQKRRIFDYYKQVLGDLPGIEFMPEAEYGRSTRWLTCITINPKEFGATREDVRLKLEEYNIESRPLWKPMHMQPVFAKCRIVGGSVSERLFEIGLCLPSGTAMSEDDLSFICDVIRSVHKR